MKVKPTHVRAEDRKKYIRALDALYTAVSEVGGRDEVKRLLRDLLTESERLMIGRRILIAQKLLRDISYDEIIRELGVGKDTIMRVHRWLLDEEKGVENVVRKLESAILERRYKPESVPLDPFSWAGIKKRYPLHSLIFNIFNELSKDRKKR